MANTKAFKVKNGLELQEYAKSINDTAVDVFVYDTSKDSDGGAWRHRTQATSWYNETLNTATRGSRKEFPAVAVIVAETTQVTIYDGDDPDLPMWMVFNGLGTGIADANYALLISSSFPATSVSMLNATLCVTGYYIHRFNFVSEDQVLWGSAPFERPVSMLDRNIAIKYRPSPDLQQIIAPYCNDVAMTVLPNAPIDAASGLSVPTIAVATDNGVSIIKDDGTVVDYTLSSTNRVSRHIQFPKKGGIIYGLRSGSNNENVYFIGYNEIASSDVSSVPDFQFTGSTAGGAAGQTPTLRYEGSQNACAALVEGDISYFGTRDGGLVQVDRSAVTTVSSKDFLYAQIQISYNTGWMNGDIKLATLSDTDATNVSYNNTVTNPDFASGITGYTANNATLAYDSGNARMSVTPTALYGGALQTLPATSTGKRYIFGATITTTVVNQNIRVQISGIGATQPSQIYNEAGTQVVWGIYDSEGGTPTLQFSSYDGTNYNQTFYVDNVFFSEAEEDRSINGNALQVFGTVTKSAAATGTDLVAYSGWSSSNYLEQPPNPDLNFGTSDFCIMGWVKKDATASYRRFFSLQDPTGVQGDNDAINIKFANESTGGELYAYLGATEGSIPTSNVDYIGPGNWGHFALVRQNMTYYMYVNGNLIASKASTMSKGSSTSIVRIGQGAEGLESFTAGSCALFRVSRTAPSAEQVSKIYQTEKTLFEDGAQATLYGATDSIVAMAYDDDTNLLHVGTSSGRSVFQGLRRVDNTTDAATVAISASNGMIAED